MRKPDVAANNAMMADAGLSPQDRSVGINGHVVFEVRMPLVLVPAT